MATNAGLTASTEDPDMFHDGGERPGDINIVGSRACD
jgi:hypothetical protein